MTQTGRIDYERTPQLQFVVIAVDSGQPALTSTATVRVEVLNINDHNPRFTQVSTQVHTGLYSGSHRSVLANPGSHKSVFSNPRFTQVCTQGHTGQYSNSHRSVFRNPRFTQVSSHQPRFTQVSFGLVYVSVAVRPLSTGCENQATKKPIQNKTLDPHPQP